MIKLSGGEYGEIWFDPESGTRYETWNVQEGEHTTRIVVAPGHVFVVAETPTEVVRKVLEYKLYLIQHQVYISNEESYPAAHGARKGLRKLAGLEESQ